MRAQSLYATAAKPFDLWSLSGPQLELRSSECDDLYTVGKMRERRTNYRGSSVRESLTFEVKFVLQDAARRAKLKKKKGKEVQHEDFPGGHPS